MEENQAMHALEAQIRECFARVIITHKTQEKCADILNRRNAAIKNWQIALSALTTGGVLAALNSSLPFIEYITMAVSAALFALNSYAKNHNPGEIAQEHSNSASKLWNIRESYLSLLTDIRAGRFSVEEVAGYRDSLQKELFSVYKVAPRSLGRAYNDAIGEVRAAERRTFTNEEIDKELPQSLRKAETDAAQ